MGTGVGLIAAAAAAVVCVGCEPSDDRPAPSPASSTAPRVDPLTREDLIGRSYVLEALPDREIVPGTSVSVSFRAGQLEVYAGCNHQAASWDVVDDRLITREYITTAIACQAPLADQDAWLRSLVYEAPNLSLDGDQLTLTLRTRSLTLGPR